MEKTIKMLIINPGSTSTKVSYFENKENRFTQSIFHDAPVLLQYPTTNDQLPMRRRVIEEFLRSRGIAPEDIDVFVGRGGCAYSQGAGVMEIDRQLVEDTAADVGGSDHPAKLGVMLAWELGRKYGGSMYTMNPTNVDELWDYAHRHCRALPPGPDSCAQPEGHRRHSRQNPGKALRRIESHRLPH